MSGQMRVQLKVHGYIDRESGAVSLPALLIMLFVSSLLIGAGVLIRTIAYPIFEYSQGMQSREYLQSIRNEILTAMHSDETPESDSPKDTWHSRLEQIASEYNVEIEAIPLSDAVNPNYATIEFLSSERIAGNLQISPSVIEGIKQFRYDNGIAINLKNHYSAFFPEETIEEQLTPYGWPNINNIDINVADLLFTAETGRNCAEYLKNLRRDQRTVADTEELKQSTGADSPGGLTTASQYNVHYLSEGMLLGILEYIAGFKLEERQIPAPVQAYQLIINGREHGEILPEQLQEILNIPKQPHPVFSYIGTITWFWKIRIYDEKNQTSLESIVCKIPAETNPLYTDMTFNDPIFQTLPMEINMPVSYDLPAGTENRYQIMSTRYINE